MSNKETKDVNILTFKPNILIKIGCVLNIIFATIFSIFVYALFFTITTIVLNIILLFPKYSHKRYRGITLRTFAVIFSVLSSLVMMLVILFFSDVVISLYNEIAWYVNGIVFWRNADVMIPLTQQDQLETWIVGFFAGTSLLGNVFLFAGWFKQVKTKK